MQSSVSKWGNSLALRLPARLVRDSSLSEGSAVTIQLRPDGSILVVPTRVKYSLDDLLVSAASPDGPAETAWGEAQGREVW